MAVKSLAQRYTYRTFYCNLKGERRECSGQHDSAATYLLELVALTWDIKQDCFLWRWEGLCALMILEAIPAETSVCDDSNMLGRFQVKDQTNMFEHRSNNST